MAINLGALFGTDTSDQQAAAQQAALAAVMGVQLPDFNAMKLDLEKYKSAGLLSPEAEQTILENSSNYNNISTDPRLKQAQMNALLSLQGVGKGGLRPEDMSAINQIKQQADVANQGRQQAILQDMQQRGQGGSGSELAARLSASQQAANTAGTNSNNLASTISQRALQALSSAGSLGGQIQAQDFSQQAQKSAAQDAIDRFNAANRQNVSNTNTSTRNAAQGANLQNAQSIMNANTGLSNQQQQYNSQLQQLQYQDALQRAQGIYGAQNNYANQLYNQQQGANQQAGGIISGLIGGGAALGDYLNKKPPSGSGYDSNGGGSGPDAIQAGAGIAELAP